MIGLGALFEVVDVKWDEITLRKQRANDITIHKHNGTDGGYISFTHAEKDYKISRLAIWTADCAPYAMHIAYTYQPRSWRTGRFSRRVRVMCGKNDQ